MWLHCDDLPPGASSTTFYLPGQLKPMEEPDYGTDPKTAAVQDEPATVPALERTNEA